MWTQHPRGGDAVVLVMAKAPVPGQVKTRLGTRIGQEAAASLASACVLDTLDVCAEAFPGPDRRHIALAGELSGAVREAELRELLGTWTLHPQRGEGFAERLANAHADVARTASAPVVQVGMDTPHVTAAQLTAVAEAVGQGNGAVLGPSEDGGWWVLAVADPRLAQPLARVEMSTEQTYVDTLAALEGAGATVASTDTLRDIDTVDDAHLAAAAAPHTRFARQWRELRQGSVA
jgi:glycosyltransferase A (GT-A) superfamily protein (DUF2064 family)